MQAIKELLDRTDGKVTEKRLLGITEPTYESIQRSQTLLIQAVNRLQQAQKEREALLEEYFTREDNI